MFQTCNVFCIFRLEKGIMNQTRRLVDYSETESDSDANSDSSSYPSSYRANLSESEDTMNYHYESDDNHYPETPSTSEDVSQFYRLDLQGRQNMPHFKTEGTSYRLLLQNMERATNVHSVIDAVFHA